MPAWFLLFLLSSRSREIFNIKFLKKPCQDEEVWTFPSPISHQLSKSTLSCCLRWKQSPNYSTAITCSSTQTRPDATIDLKGGTPISHAWRASLIQVIWEGNKSILNLNSPNSLLSYKIFSFSFFTLLLWFPTTQEYSERHTYKNMAYALMTIVLIEASTATSFMVIYVL